MNDKIDLQPSTIIQLTTGANQIIAHLDFKFIFVDSQLDWKMKVVVVECVWHVTGEYWLEILFYYTNGSNVISDEHPFRH